MKKCPKCGAVLDDSKVKCYMCGTDLQRQTLTNFGNSFNENVGATVSSSQGNVFSQNNQINNNVNNPANAVGGNTTFFSNSNFSNSVYNNQLNSLNSMAYDDRTALEKMFSSDDRFKSKAEINAERAMKENQKRNSFVDAFSSMNVEEQKPKKKGQVPNNKGNKNAPAPMAPGQPMPKPMQNNQPMPPPMQNTQQVPKPMGNNGQPGMMMNQPAQAQKKKGGLFDKLKKNKQPNGNNKNNQLPVPPEAVANNKPAINWGNDLVKGGDQGNVKGDGSFKINPSLIFNIVALIVSIAGVIFVYFKFVKTDEDGKIHTLSNLKYSIGTNFKAKDKRNNFVFYSYGEFCSIAIESGPTNAVDSFVDEYYDKLKAKYEKDELNVSKSTAKYNNNVWTEINILGLSANAASANGYTSQTKIQFIAIVNEGNYYTIAYQNTNNNTICSASYDSFLHSLRFK